VLDVARQIVIQVSVGEREEKAHYNHHHLILKPDIENKCYSSSVILCNFAISPLIFESCLLIVYASAVTVFCMLKG
jgi:hypothetical protein